MTIQETIIEALKASQSAHSRALATIASLRTEKAALEAELARLNSQVANLKSQISHLEAECVKIVEPTSVQSLLASLLQIVEETQHATLLPASATSGHGAGDRTRDEDSAPSSLVGRPVLTFQQRQILDRGEGSSQEAYDVAR